MADYAIKPFRAALAEGGFVEGRNLTVIYRSAEGQSCGEQMSVECAV
jgi:hypothetical protein